MKMVDAGTSYGGSIAYETKEPKKIYPRLTLDLDAFPDLAEVGEENTLCIKVKTVAVRDDEQGGSVDVEVQECGMMDDAAEEKNDADKELEKMSKK